MSATPEDLKNNSAQANAMLQMLMGLSNSNNTASGADPNAYETEGERLTSATAQAARDNIQHYQAVGSGQIAQNRQDYGTYQPHQGSGLVGQLLGNTLNQYVHGKLTKLQGEEDLKSQQDYLKAMPKDLTPTQQANYLQQGPTVDLQKTGNNMLQQMLGNQDAASYQPPKTVMSGVENQPELQRPMQFNQQTHQFEPIPNTYPIGAKIPYGAEQRLNFSEKADTRAEKSDIRAEKSDARAEKSAVRADINQQQTNDRMDRQFVQQQYTNEMQKWRMDNPNYEANQKQLLDAQRGHKDLVDRANELKAELLNKDNWDRHNLRTNKVLSNKWTALTYSIRAPALQNTGVLNAGEIPQLMNSVADPTAWGVNGWTPTSEIVKQIDALVKTSENGIKNVKGLTTPKTPQPEAPNFYQSPKAPETGTTAQPKQTKPLITKMGKSGKMMVYDGIGWAYQ